jgi:hypothetical protein
VELRRTSGEFWVAALSRRASARQGGLGNVNGVLDCFQWKERGTAGGASDADDLRPTMLASFGCKIG